VLKGGEAGGEVDADGVAGVEGIAAGADDR
jgi:hypothetical protein